MRQRQPLKKRRRRRKKRQRSQTMTWDSVSRVLMSFSIAFGLHHKTSFFKIGIHSIQGKRITKKKEKVTRKRITKRLKILTLTLTLITKASENTIFKQIALCRLYNVIVHKDGTGRCFAILMLT